MIILSLVWLLVLGFWRRNGLDWNYLPVTFNISNLFDSWLCLMVASFLCLDVEENFLSSFFNASMMRPGLISYGRKNKSICFLSLPYLSIVYIPGRPLLYSINLYHNLSIIKHQSIFVLRIGRIHGSV